MYPSKIERLNKIINPSTRRTIIVPLDHGVSDGPMDGLVDMAATIRAIKVGGADALVLHKGMITRYRETIGNFPVLLHVSASTGLGVVLRKVLVATPQEALNLGCAGVSIHINMNNQYEPEMLHDLGQVSRECNELGLPLLVMMYVRDIVDGRVVTAKDPELVKHAARVAAELGADMVKVSYTGSPESFAEVVRGCGIPVVIAGGAKESEEAMLGTIGDSLTAGGAGVSCGRNVFQHEDVAGMLGKIKKLVHH